MNMFGMGPPLDALKDLSRNKPRFRHVAMEGRHATGELEGFPAPLSGVLPDLSFARDNAHEINPPASSLAGYPG